MKNIYWFTHDLRVKDNPLLARARNSQTPLLAVYLVDSDSYQQMGAARKQFIHACLDDLRESLAQINIQLRVEQKPWAEQADYLNQLCAEHHSATLYVCEQAGSYERGIIEQLTVKVETDYSSTLFCESDLPFSLAEMPSSFSKARRLWEKDSALMATLSYDALLTNHPQLFDSMQSAPCKPLAEFKGGEHAAEAHLHSYFSSQAPSYYKQTRNALDGWLQSTKLSPWLAHGCISPRQVMLALRYYETRHGANESTYWIFFELLWREYFFWYARAHRERVFTASGLRDSPAYAMNQDHDALNRWQQGLTEFPLVNACMRQLNETGYMSNRGRQLVASCLVNELKLDWRLGAQYFERQLIDYDVASNWGNWQYLGGVGADPRGLRRFDQEKQQHTYDPYGEFIKRWQGYAASSP